MLVKAGIRLGDMRRGSGFLCWTTGILSGWNLQDPCRFRLIIVLPLPLGQLLCLRPPDPCSVIEMSYCDCMVNSSIVIVKSYRA